MAVATAVFVQPRSCSPGDRTAAFQVKIKRKPRPGATTAAVLASPSLPRLGIPASSGPNWAAPSSWKVGPEQHYLGGDGDPLDAPCSQPGSPEWVSLQGRKEKGEGGGKEIRKKKRKPFSPFLLEMKEYTSKLCFLKDILQCCSCCWSRAAGICVCHPGPSKLWQVLPFISCRGFLPFISCRARGCCMGSPSPLAMPERSVSWHGRAGE